MKKGIIGVAFAMLFSLGCVPSAEKLCEGGIETTCDNAHRCAPAADAAERAAFESFFGVDAAACITTFGDAANCAQYEDKDELCDDGETYAPLKAKKCKNAVYDQSCEDQATGTVADPACDEICTTG